MGLTEDHFHFQGTVSNVISAVYQLRQTTETVRLDGNVGLNVNSILVNTDMIDYGNVAYRSNIQWEQQWSKYWTLWDARLTRCSLRMLPARWVGWLMTWSRLRSESTSNSWLSTAPAPLGQLKSPHSRGSPGSIRNSSRRFGAELSHRHAEGRGWRRSVNSAQVEMTTGSWQLDSEALESRDGHET